MIPRLAAFSIIFRARRAFTPTGIFHQRLGTATSRAFIA